MELGSMTVTSAECKGEFVDSQAEREETLLLALRLLFAMDTLSRLCLLGAGAGAGAKKSDIS